MVYVEPFRQPNQLVGYRLMFDLLEYDTSPFLGV